MPVSGPLPIIDLDVLLSNHERGAYCAFADGGKRLIPEPSGQNGMFLNQWFEWILLILEK
jgi:hypothetical protein